MSFLKTFYSMSNQKIEEHLDEISKEAESYKKSLSIKKRNYTKNINKGSTEKEEIINALELEIKSIQDEQKSMIEEFINYKNQILNYEIQNKSEDTQARKAPKRTLDNCDDDLNNSKKMKLIPEITESQTDSTNVNEVNEQNLISIPETEDNTEIKEDNTNETCFFNKDVINTDDNIINLTSPDKNPSNLDDTVDSQKTINLISDERDSDVMIINSAKPSTCDESKLSKKIESVENLTSCSELSLKTPKSDTSTVTSVKPLFKSKFYKKASSEFKDKKKIVTPKLTTVANKGMTSKIESNSNILTKLNDVGKRLDDKRTLAALKMKELQKDRIAYQNMQKPNINASTIKPDKVASTMKQSKNVFKPTGGLIKNKETPKTNPTPKLVPSTKKAVIAKPVIRPIKTPSNPKLSNSIQKPQKLTSSTITKSTYQSVNTNKENVEQSTSNTNGAAIKTQSTKPSTMLNTISEKAQSTISDLLSQSMLKVINDHGTIDIEELPSDSDDDDEQMICSLPRPIWSTNAATIDRVNRYNQRHFNPRDIFRPPNTLKIDLERLFCRYEYKDKAPRGSSIWLPHEMLSDHDDDVIDTN